MASTEARPLRSRRAARAPALVAGGSTRFLAASLVDADDPGMRARAEGPRPPPSAARAPEVSVRTRLSTLPVLLTAAAVALGGLAALAGEPSITAHEVTVSLDPANQSLDATDVLTVKRDGGGALRFSLNAAFESRPPSTTDGWPRGWSGWRTTAGEPPGRWT